ncbi:phosphodiesterase [Streptomyces virginiae]|uniref:phosphodiesterase n=1 Tax=Streptomyces virginiae TaxID=1961 RepID=UPI003453FC34
MQELIATGCFHSAVPEGRAVLSAVRAARASGSLVVDAGDFFSGGAFHAFSHGRVEQRLLTELYDAVVPGNHDLADLMRLQDPRRFPPVVCVNLHPPSGFSGRWVSGLVLPGAGRRIGIIGYLGRQAFGAIPAAEREGFVFVPPTARLVAAEAERLRGLGADVVVGVSHSGFLDAVADQEADWPLPTVIAAHCHSPWSHWSQSGRHVAKPPANGGGLLRLHLDPHGPHRVTQESFPSTIHPKDGLAGDLDAYAAWGGERLGSLPDPLPDREGVAVRLADRARVALGAAAFLLNTYTLRTGLPAVVTRRDLHACAPFDSSLVVLERAHRTDALVRRAHELGEATTVSVDSHTPDETTVATTSYLAERLNLPARPPDPPRTLHGILTNVVQEP